MKGAEYDTTTWIVTYKKSLPNLRIIKKWENPLIASSSPLHRKSVAEKIGSVLMISFNSWKMPIQTTFVVIKLKIFSHTAVVAIVLFC